MVEDHLTTVEKCKQCRFMLDDGRPERDSVDLLEALSSWKKTRRIGLTTTRQMLIGRLASDER
jgi:hypothetical protein